MDLYIIIKNNKKMIITEYQFLESRLQKSNMSNESYFKPFKGFKALTSSYLQDMQDMHRKSAKKFKTLSPEEQEHIKY
jgi:hypothetical protein